MDAASAFSFDMTYCGPPPAAAELWGRWNFDPFLIIALVAGGLAVALHLRQAGRGRLLALAAAWCGLVILFVSPLCALTVALFSARVTHHVLLTMLVAPLLVLAIGPGRTSGREGLLPPLALSTALFWLWHMPPIYAAALSDPLVYWLMQLSLLGASIWLWRGLFFARSAMAAGFTALSSAMQMGLLGSLLVFAPNPLYWPHLATTAAFGLTPLGDQQLAGLVMWVPANLPLLALVLWRLVDMLHAGRESTAR